MFKLKDLLFFLFSTIGFFILLILFNYLGLKESTNLFMTSFIYGLMNTIYALYYDRPRHYFFLLIAFYVLILLIGTTSEIFLVYSGIFLAFSLNFIFKNRNFFKQFIRAE